MNVLIPKKSSCTTSTSLTTFFPLPTVYGTNAIGLLSTSPDPNTTGARAFSNLAAGVSFFGAGSIDARPPILPPLPPRENLGFLRGGSSVEGGAEEEEEEEGRGRSSMILTGPLAFFAGRAESAEAREEVGAGLEELEGGGSLRDEEGGGSDMVGLEAGGGGTTSVSDSSPLEP